MSLRTGTALGSKEALPQHLRCGGESCLPAWRLVVVPQPSVLRVRCWCGQHWEARGVCNAARRSNHLADGVLVLQQVWPVGAVALAYV
jgi:hypothetical protein